jgi:hypothetical protein
MEQFYDYKMVDKRLVLQHAHVIHALAKEHKQFPCMLLDKFFTDNIIIKLTPS